jgi:putative tryptophan/tyrosine transport system substrate-binding protein
MKRRTPLPTLPHQACTRARASAARVEGGKTFIRRRSFIAQIGAAAAWPLPLRAQQSARLPVIGVAMPLAADDPEARARLTAFKQRLQELGLNVGHDVQIEYRWGAGDADLNRRNAAELVDLAPAVILATGSPTLEPLLQATRTVPIVFVQVADPVGAGMVESLSHPGGNATGFTNSDYTAAGKWLELLKDTAPNVTRVAFLRDPATAAGIGQWGASEAFAPAFGMELRPVNVAVDAEVERAIAKLAGETNGGIIVANSGPSIARRDVIIALAARNRLPAIYPQRLFAVAGGLMSYGSNSIEPYRRAASYVARILKGEKPADLPVQNPTKFELVVNLKTAKALGVEMPGHLLARADEVIE